MQRGKTVTTIVFQRKHNYTGSPLSPAQCVVSYSYTSAAIRAQIAIALYRMQDSL